MPIYLGTDPNEDPKLALALQMSLEDERIRREQENARKQLETGGATENPSSNSNVHVPNPEDLSSEIDDISTIIVEEDSEIAIEMQPLSPGTHSH